VEVRAARRDDAADVAALLDQLGYPADVAQVERRLDVLLGAREESLFVADLDGRVVALSRLQVSPALEYDGLVGKLGALVVDERHRRRGIGRALVQAVEEEARHRGCVLLFLTTADRRKDAHAFYARIGYQETGRRFAKTLSSEAPSP
jgi:GNAT superfamily N-acetyltransferase